jgi:mutator protein MutT
MADFPAPKSAAEAPRLDVAIAVIARAGRVLICQRPAGGAFAGFWEFPGGKRERDETLEHCLKREVLEELGIRVRPVHAMRPVDHDYPERRIRLHPYVCAHVDGEPQMLACQAVLWVHPRDLANYTFPPANERLIEEAIEYLTRGPNGGAGASTVVDFDTRIA